MLKNVLIVRDNKALDKTVYAIENMEARFKDVKCVDSSDWANPVPSFINQLYCMIQLSKNHYQMCFDAWTSFRGAHYKPDFDLNQPGNFDPHEYIDYQEQKPIRRSEGGSVPARSIWPI